MLWGNDAIGVWIDMGGWRVEALAWPDEKHLKGRDHLVRVSYLYIPFSGWVRKERVTERSPFARAQDKQPF